MTRLIHSLPVVLGVRVDTIRGPRLCTDGLRRKDRGSP